MKVSLQVKKKPRIEMIPLIDLMFLILVSFVYGVFFMSVHRGVPVALPLSSTAKIENAAHSDSQHSSRRSLVPGQGAGHS